MEAFKKTKNRLKQKKRDFQRDAALGDDHRKMKRVKKKCSRTIQRRKREYKRAHAQMGEGKHACERTREMCDMPQEVVVKQRGLRSVFNPVFFLIITFTRSMSLFLSFSTPPQPQTHAVGCIGCHANRCYIHFYIYVEGTRERKTTRESGKDRRGDSEQERFNCSATINAQQSMLNCD